MSRDVTRAGHQPHRSRVKNVGRDKHIFSDTAQNTHSANNAPYNPLKRGGNRM